MNTIGERIAFLRNSRNMSQRALMEELNISNLGRIEKNERLPGIEIIISLSNYFGVSTDWILKGDLENDYNYYHKKFLKDPVKVDLHEMPSSIGERMKKLREINNLSTQKLAIYLREPTRNIEAYENNSLKPSEKTIDALCKLYDVSRNYLLDHDDHGQQLEKDIELQTFINHKDLIQKFNMLDRDEQIKIEGIIDGMLISKELQKKKCESSISKNGEEAATDETA